jgi:DNA glycosylase AlkZ-like
MTWSEVWQRRLAQHHLVEPAPQQHMAEVVAQVCGIHAQIATSAELSLGLRLRGITREDVSAALWKQRSLVKTFGLRGTLHLLPASEFGTWIAALKAKPPPREPSADESPSLPHNRGDQLVRAICDALANRELTNDDLSEELEGRLGDWATEAVFPAFGQHWPRWQLALRQAALAGLIVNGPPRGTRVTYVRTEDWLGRLPDVDGQSALAEVCLRFLNAYGPATPAEFARWFNTRPAAARRLMQSLDVEEVDVEGWRAWLPRDSANTAYATGSVLLLPQFDCYVVGGFPRKQLIPPVAPAALQRGTVAPFSVVLVDGVVAGLWERKRRGSQLDLRVHTFEPLMHVQRRAAEEQAERVAAILQSRPNVSFGPVEARAHL